MLFKQYKKWSLFCVLAGSVGFSLSMNPEHFNNIVRYEKDTLHSIAFASSAEKKSEVSKVSASSREVLVGTSKGNFKAKVYSLDDSTIVKFERLDSTEGKECGLCGKTFSLKADFEDISALNNELMTIANADQKEEKSEDDKKVVAQKKGEATEVDVEEWAAKCEKISESAKLSCHKNRIIELSKFLKNSPDTASYIQQYFTDYLKSDILAGFSNPTIKTSPFSNGYGVMSATMEQDSSQLEQSNELAEQLISGLQAKNGKSTIEVLVKMRASSFTSQMRHSQNLMIQGLNESNPTKFNLGMQGMQPDMQKALLQQGTQSMLDAVSSMPASATEKSYFSQYVSNNMFAPVDNVLNQLRSHILNNQTQTTGQNGQVQSNWATFMIPSLGESMILTSPGVVLDTNLNTMIIRQGSQARGGNIQVPAQWGTGQGVVSSNGLYTLPSPMMNPGQQQPQVGRTARSGTPF